MTAVHEDTGELLGLSDERDVQLELRQRAWREGWDAGYADGYDAGHQDEAAARDRDWRRIARPIARGGPSAAELEAKRWTVRGERRTPETFGQPHPDDFPGRGAA